MPGARIYGRSGDWVAEIDPADIYGVGLAATPSISLDLGLSFDFQGNDMIAPTNRSAYKRGFSAVGYIDLGADFVLRKNLSLSLSAAAGVTDDATDFTLSLAVPYRF